MKKLFIALLFVPISAFAFRGQVEVHLPLSLEVSDGVNFVAPGTYDFEMSQRQKKLSFEIEIPQVDDPEFDIVSKQPFPINGAFRVPAALSGQNFDVGGVINTFHSVSNPMWERVMCQVQIPRQVCRMLPNGMTQCWWVYQWVNGYQDLQYRLRSEDREAVVNLFVPNVETIAATFRGHESYTSKDILYQSPCYY